MSRLLAFFMVLLACPVLAEVPRRIVSMNVCADQLLLQLVPREHIASVSYLAADPRYSSVAELALGLPQNRGLAEEVITLNPDLIVTGPFSATQAANLLERKGYPITRLGLATTIEEVVSQIKQTGEITGAQTRASTIATTLQAGISASTVQLKPVLQNRSALFLSNNGVVYGSGTLQHSFLLSLGLHNTAAEAGLAGPAQLPLEIIVASTPDFILIHPGTRVDTQMAHPLLQHPVWRRLGQTSRRIALRDNWFDCAGAQLLEAYQALEAALL